MSHKSFINLLDHQFTVVFESPGHWAGNGMGRASLHEHQITINHSLPQDSISCTLLHEITHLISDMGALELTENQVEVVALGMHSFLKRNPKMYKRMWGKN